MTTRKTTTKKAVKKTSGKRGRKPSVQDNAKITLLVKANPRREGTKAHKRYSLYKTGMTVGDYLKKGGSRGSLRKDLKLKRVKVTAVMGATKKTPPKSPKQPTTKAAEPTTSATAT